MSELEDEMADVTDEPFYRRKAWVLLFGLGILIVLFAFYPFFVPVDPNNFESSTAVVWADYEAANPEAADYLAREARLLSAAWLGYGLFAAGLAATYFRRGDRTAATMMWIFPLVLAIVSVVFFADGDTGLGSIYAVVSAVAALGVLAGSGRRVEAVA